MNKSQHILFEKYNALIGEAGYPKNAVGSAGPLTTLKWGKYTLIPNKPARKYDYKTACENYISTATRKNLKDFENIGFIFNEAMFVYEATTGNVSTIVFGTDPKKEPVAYYRKANSTMGPPATFYYKDRKVSMPDTYKTFSSELPEPVISVEDFISKWACNALCTIRPNGTIDIDGILRIAPIHNRFMTIEFKKVPYKIGIVTQHVGVESDKLETLENFPDFIGDDLILCRVPNLKNLDGFPQEVKRDLNICDCPHIDNRMLLDARVGDKVKGKITIDNGFVDKKQFTQKYFDILNRDNPGMPVEF